MRMGLIITALLCYPFFITHTGIALVVPSFIIGLYSLEGMRKKEEEEKEDERWIKEMQEW